MKKALLAMLLALGGTAVQAAPTTYSFVYQGFTLSVWEEFWVGAKRLAGTFAGEDINGDGYIKLNELTSLQVGGHEYVEQYGTGVWLSNFSYGGGSKLAFNTGYEKFYDAGMYSYREAYDFDSERDYSYYIIEGVYMPTELWMVSPGKTILTVSPVPEPSSLAMSAVGLGLAGLMARRRKRSARPAA